MSPRGKFTSITIWILAGLQLLFSSLNSPVFAQTNISGIINTVSARIDSAYFANNTDVDSVYISDNISAFSINDTVLIHMTVGATVFTSGGNTGRMQNIRNSGKYAIFIVKDINVAEKLLILNSTLPSFLRLVSGEYKLDAGEFGQVVKVPTYPSARVKNTLTCNNYDPVTGVGGILVFMVKGNLYFDADIDVNGKGFPGAQPDPFDYTGTCSSQLPLDPQYQELYLDSSLSMYSAFKGYSVAGTTNTLSRGKGAVINGGGGGNGKYSGGGGGANGGNGGRGGDESGECGSVLLGGNAGEATTLFYLDNGENRISLGGGGGTASYTLPLKATAGGAGGGIVVIVCDTMIGTAGKNIFARGDSVIEFASAGAGGGGAGGTIILHVNKYKTAPKLWVTGGAGGSIHDTVTIAKGPGGGGGGGVIWYNGVSTSSYDNTSGDPGGYKALPTTALGGSSKSPISNLKIPIRGFLFNYIPAADTICFNDAPHTINAAPPVGGTGIFSYNWLQSADSLVWGDAAGTRDKVTYTPPPGTNITMWYKRAVDNAGLIKDTSNVVKMWVMPLLTNNSIKPDPDTIVCATLKAGTLYTQLQMAGGNGKYKYFWEKSADNTFSSSVTVGTSALYVTPVFTADTYYRRKVTSGPVNTCKSTSNTIKITVLPVISNNIIDSTQEICISRTPDLLTGRVLSGGAGAGSYAYQWQEKSTGSWSDKVTTSNYQSLPLVETHDFRRIVISGSNNTCKDTSAAIMVTVMPAITNNSLKLITQSELCSGLPGDTLEATFPANGNGVYSYYWQNDASKAVGTVLTDTTFNPGILTSTAVYRRVVTSGINNDNLQRCHSISNTRTITVLEKITNNSLDVPAQTIWCEGKSPAPIVGLLPQNGKTGSYNYLWQRKFPTGTWADTAVNAKDLNTPVLISSTTYRRIVKSGLNNTCIDTSNIISFTMQDSLRNNSINNNVPVFVCFDEDSTLQASIPGVLTGGDETNYSYQWTESSASNGIYNDISGETGSIYTTEPIQTTRYYKRKVSSGDCINTSLPVKIETLPLPELTALSAGINEICFNKLYSVINAEVQKGSLPYLVSFEDGQGFTDSRVFAGNTQSIKPEMDGQNIPVNPGYLDYNFKIKSILDSKGCWAKASNTVTFNAPLRVFITPDPKPISDTINAIESCSSNLQISVDPSIGVSSWHLRNIHGVTADNTNSAVINLTATYAANSSASVSLYYVEDIANCPSDTLHFEAILYNNPDSIKLISRVVDEVDFPVGDTLIIFISDNQKFKAEPVVYGTSSWLIKSGAGELSDPAALITDITKLKQDDPAYLQYSISNGTCAPSVRVIKIERRELLIYDGFSPNDDGINDELWSVGLADEEVDFKFQIFSSSGNFVREITRKDIKDSNYIDYGNNKIVLWDGTTSLGGEGNYVPEGTYYYVLIVKYHNQNFDKKGFIIVKR